MRSRAILLAHAQRNNSLCVITVTNLNRKQYCIIQLMMRVNCAQCRDCKQFQQNNVSLLVTNTRSLFSPLSSSFHLTLPHYLPFRLRNYMQVIFSHSIRASYPSSYRRAAVVSVVVPCKRISISHRYGFQCHNECNIRATNANRLQIIIRIL